MWYDETNKSHYADDRDPRAWYDIWLAPTLEGRGGAGGLAIDLTLAAASWGMLCLGNALVFRAIGVDASIPLLATVLVIGVFAGSLVGMGGVGVTEAALVGLYTQIGISGPEAAAGALLHRVSYYAVILIWGAIAFVRMSSEARQSRSPGSRDADSDDVVPGAADDRPDPGAVYRPYWRLVPDPLVDVTPGAEPKPGGPPSTPLAIPCAGPSASMTSAVESVVIAGIS